MTNLIVCLLTLLFSSSSPAREWNADFGALQLPQREYHAQRERIQAADFSQWHYSYDKLGQVESGKRFWNDFTPVAGEQFEYIHDTIGNRRSTKAGGDTSGGALRTANYSVNDLNQIASRDVPGAVDIIGAATATNIVTVNGNPASRQGEFYHHELAVNNAAGPVWQGVTNSLYETNVSVTGFVLIPPATQSLQYDADGNLTNDLVWHYHWDGENRLVQVSNTTSVASDGRRKLDFDYDHAGRRYRKIVSAWNGSAWVPAKTNCFYRGGTLVGIVALVGSDQPYFCGRIEPTDGYGEIAPLVDRLVLNRQQRLSPEIMGVSVEKRTERNRLAYEHAQIVAEFARPGLRMVDAATGELVFEPLELQVDERGFWWRGHVWKNGKRII